MKLMKIFRYPLLFLAVILVPTSLAALFAQIPNILPIEPRLWGLIGSLTGYTIGYILIYLFTKAINRSFDRTIYSKRIRTSYLAANAIVAILTYIVLSTSIAILYAEQPFSQAAFIIFIGLPWLSVQMLLLLFFVRSESLFE